MPSKLDPSRGAKRNDPYSTWKQIKAQSYSIGAGKGPQFSWASVWGTLLCRASPPQCARASWHQCDESLWERGLSVVGKSLWDAAALPACHMMCVHLTRTHADKPCVHHRYLSVGSQSSWNSAQVNWVIPSEECLCYCHRLPVRSPCFQELFLFLFVLLSFLQRAIVFFWRDLGSKDLEPDGLTYTLQLRKHNTITRLPYCLFLPFPHIWLSLETSWN